MTFLVSVTIKLKIQTCPRRHLGENEIKKRKPSSKPKTVQTAQYKNTYIKITNMKHFKKINNIKLN